ncbi:steroid 5-alpha-reductase DET2 [Typha angustifolia]|uniref:steroid 5-alpha-reductase DET2 n=1 Tax=Typha angustifolia TaxID=59011 RepID=UPI003C2CF5AF
MEDSTLFSAALISLYLITPITILFLQFLSAPYGKHFRPGWGPTIPSPLAWLLMESPTLWLSAFLFPLGRHRRHPLALAAFLLFLLHYLNRTLLFPLILFLNSKRKGYNPKPFPLLIAAFAFAFNLLNAYLQSRSVSHYSSYPDPIPPWTYARVAVGAFLFFWGMRVNIQSDRTLMRLKEEAKGGYKIPRGGWFEVVSCPNYMGEGAEWLGWALVAWSPAALGFFMYTCANLGPRARAHRSWYIEKFGAEYPAKKKAFVPFVY